MEIEVGEYVRTERGIFKVYCIGPKEIDDKKEYYKLLVERNEKLFIEDSDFIIGKPCKNIIELIEAGDLIEINNEKYEVIYDKSYEKLGILILNKKQLAVRHCSLEYVFSDNGLEEFKNIRLVTKEQFKNIEYEV